MNTNTRKALSALKKLPPVQPKAATVATAKPPAAAPPASSMTSIMDIPMDILKQIMDTVPIADEFRVLKYFYLESLKDKKNLKLKIFFQSYIENRYRIQITFKPEASKRSPRKLYDFECDVPTPAGEPIHLKGQLTIDHNFHGVYKTFRFSIVFDPITIEQTYYNRLEVHQSVLGGFPEMALYVMGNTPTLQSHGLKPILFQHLAKIMYFTIVRESAWKEYKSGRTTTTILNAPSYIQTFMETHIPTPIKMDFWKYENGRNRIANTITIDARNLKLFNDDGTIIPIQSRRSKYAMTAFQVPNDDYIILRGTTGGTNYIINSLGTGEGKVELEEVEYEYRFRESSSGATAMHHLQIQVIFKTPPNPSDYMKELRKFSRPMLNTFVKIVHYNLWTKMFGDSPDQLLPHLNNVEFVLIPHFLPKGNFFLE
jgi:hypothetical protein